MRLVTTVSVLFISVLIFAGFTVETGKSKKELTAVKVKDLLSQMTLEEKIGQMTQITMQVISKKQGTKDTKHELDHAKLKEAIIKYHIGSIINVYDIAHTLDYWHYIHKSVQDVATKETRLKIPVLYGIDAIHGANYTTGATLFPQAINMGATFNRELVKRSGEITSLETKASGIPWNFYPVMDLGRNPLWPRLWETYGEDVYLASELGVSYIKGAQGDDMSAKDKLATCLKHYVGYSFPLNGKDRTPAWISERMLREYFLPTFEAGIKAGSPTIMVNSSEVDGIPVHSDYHLLTEVLRNELKFEGFVVSDWEDIIRLYTRDRVAESPKEAVRMAVMAGVDMSMVPYDFSFYELLLELVKEGSVPVSRIDEAVSRILTVKFDLGLFENPYPDESLKSQFASDEHTKANYDASLESIVMVKNEKNLLPLSTGKKILVTGPTANLLSALNSGWTITWQGNEESAYPHEKMTLLEAIEEKAGKNNVTFLQGSTFNETENLSEILSAAKKSDVVILSLGESAYCETPGNINDLTLDKAQLELAKEVYKAGKPVVLVMLQGRPRIINEIEGGASSILLGFLPGMEGGRALADIIFGDAYPSGKLPVTYPRFPNAITHYDYKPLELFDVNVINPQWEFGHGLSYTKFEYSDLKLSSGNPSIGDEVKVQVTVKNTGKTAGKEAVLMYVCDVFGSVSRPVKQLKGFEKIYLNADESKIVEFTITPDQLSFIGRDNKRIIEKGEFRVMIEKLEKNFVLN